MTASPVARPARDDELPEIVTLLGDVVEHRLEGVAVWGMFRPTALSDPAGSTP